MPVRAKRKYLEFLTLLLFFFSATNLPLPVRSVLLCCIEIAQIKKKKRKEKREKGSLRVSFLCFPICFVDLLRICVFSTSVNPFSVKEMKRSHRAL